MWLQLVLIVSYLRKAQFQDHWACRLHSVWMLSAPCFPGLVGFSPIREPFPYNDDLFNSLTWIYLTLISIQPNYLSLLTFLPLLVSYPATFSVRNNLPTVHLFSFKMHFRGNHSYTRVINGWDIQRHGT